MGSCIGYLGANQSRFEVFRYLYFQKKFGGHLNHWWAEKCPWAQGLGTAGVDDSQPKLRWFKNPNIVNWASNVLLSIEK
jgi:hypothetical protein